MSVDARAHRYEQIASEIRTAIARGAFGPEGRLPSERRLVRTYGAQRNTVRQALGVLEREGRIASIGKSGWFVASGADAPTDRLLTGGRVLFLTFRQHESASSDTIAHELGRVFAAHGLQVLRYDSAARQRAAHLETAEDIIELGANGVVLWPHGPVDTDLLARIQSSMPVVLVDRRAFGFASDSVRFDDFSGGKMVTEHLLAQGHRRIAFLADEPFVESVQSRWNGYHQALESAGIEPDGNLTVLTYLQSEPTFSAAMRFLVRGLPEPPTAVVCSNDGVASRLLLLLREEGLRVPEDIAVAGFGNERPNYLDLVGLTTVAQSFSDLGRLAGELLLERLSTPADPHRVYREVLLPMSLVVRSSSGPHAPSS
jgi:DNA-binding LacI/PurR family transcriptional regulator